MRLFKRRGKTLRIRPGPLANFSGGAGYMPMFVVWSVPISIIYGFVSSIILMTCGRDLYHQAVPSDGATCKLPLHSLVRYTTIHLIVTGVIGAAVSLWLFVMGINSVKGDKVEYIGATLLITAGPIVAAYLSTVLLVRLMVRDRPRWLHYFSSMLAFILMLIGFVYLGFQLA